MLTRRSFLTRSALAVAAAPLRSASYPDATAILKTPSGRLQGAVENGVRVFRGVPFAQPPVGPRRFLPPEDLQPWTDVRNATHFAAEAMQPGSEDIPRSEDCLYLNVWAPPEPGPYPVFIWSHGGGFTGGRSFDPLFDGSGFARAGVVCVTIAYRLGVFGFLDVGPLLGPDYNGSANNALKDILAALAWVQRNIAAFGGDPGRVTVGGESAGAKLIDLMLGIPSAQPLFHQAISESGGAERIFPLPRASEVTTAFAAHWSTATGQATDALRTSPAATLLQTQESFLRTYPLHFPLRPEIDGRFISQAPLTAIAEGSSRGKRLLLGTNRDESALFLGPQPATDPGSKDLGNLTLTQFQAVEARYAQVYPGMTPEQRRIRSLTAEEYWIPSLRVADAHSNAGGETFVYELTFPAPSGRYKGFAYHSFDLRFVWNYFGADTPTPEERAFAQTLHQAWVSFIQGKIPAAPGLPAWPRYNAANRPTMILDQPSHVEQAPQQAEFALWSGLLTR